MYYLLAMLTGFLAAVMLVTWELPVWVVIPVSLGVGAAIGAATAGDAAPAAVGLVTSTAPDKLARRSSMPSSPLAIVNTPPLIVISPLE